MPKKLKCAVLGALVLVCLCLGGAQTTAQETGPQEKGAPAPESWAAALDRVPEAHRPLVAEAFDLAGANSSALVNVLLACTENWLDGAVFLIENMPVEDLTLVSEEMLINNLRGAYFVRANFPWASSVPKADFLRYVLPMRVSQEPLEDWRGYFLEELTPRVQDMGSLDEVALEVNRWCGERVGFQPTQRRDQGPFETLRSGYGRCEEMMIVYIDACRSVGVPARQAWTPYWGFTDNNHAWAEVLGEDGNWHYVGACEPRDRLDDAWFNDAVKRANLVLCASCGPTEPGTPDVYREREEIGARYAIIDSIAFYRPSTELTVKLEDIDGNPVAETNVYLSVFNFGALRPIARGETNEDGLWIITVGPGGYFISAGDQVSGACMPLQIDPGDPVDVVLTLGLGAELPPMTFWLRYPHFEEESQ